jgi:hypothetical protein
MLSGPPKGYLFPVSATRSIFVVEPSSSSRDSEFGSAMSTQMDSFQRVQTFLDQGFGALADTDKVNQPFPTLLVCFHCLSLI